MLNNICLSSVQASLSLGMEQLLKEYDDVFPQDIPHGLPPQRGIEHNIDLIPGASLPNRPPIGVIQKKPKRYRNKWRNFWKKDGFGKV